jgi:S1-C subfamily serine protease
MAVFLFLILALAPPAHAEDTWESTLEIAAQAVVSLRVSATRAFDTESASNSQGTGFIVDAERGLILTNRHLVQSGPVVAEAVFLNHEEVTLEAIYRDPVHDFGLFRFDPAAVKFMDVVALPLNPKGAHVGTEIRIVGNDAGEKLSILTGTLARLDRPAPVYGQNKYNDFNTFYLQAASGTSGGSSGSPVLNIKGEVIALNAGGARRAAASYYLPLERIIRALDAIQAGDPVTRGTLQTRFQYTPYDELRRLGLQESTEAEIRAAFPEAVGMLVVRGTVPGGPAHEVMQPGDILVRMNGELLNTFVPLEALLDAHVGQRVMVGFERGGEAIEVSLQVSDLHALTAASYIEVGGGVIHALSYQQARNHAVPVQGLYVASPGYMLSAAGIPDGALIRSVGGESVDTLDDLWRILLGLGDQERVPVRYAYIGREDREQIAVITVDRRWFAMRRCTRDDTTGLWPCEDAPPPEPGPPSVPATTTMAGTGSKAAEVLAPSLVMVEFDVPYRVEGVWGSNFRGAGLVVDAEEGLILTDRDTVPVSMGDVTLTFGGSVRIPGRVIFVHPEHNVTLLAYDPTLLGDTPVASATLLPTELKPGDEVHLVALTGQHQVASRKTRVSRIDPIRLPQPSPPQHRDVNLDVLQIDDSISSVGGVLADKKGRVLALWSSFHRDDGDGAGASFRGLPVEALALLPAPFPGATRSETRLLGAELGLVRMADARERGLPPDRAAALEAQDPTRKQVLTVSRVYGGFPAADVLRGGDLILSANGHAVTRFLEVERAAQNPSITLELLRDGAVVEVQVETVAASGQGIDRALIWAGALLHEPHPEVAFQRGRPAEGVYVSWYWYGSPAYRYGLRATRRIVAIDDVPTPDLDAFMAAVAELGHGEPVRIKTKGLDDQPQVLTLKADLHYWPTREFRLAETGWEVVAAD